MIPGLGRCPGSRLSPQLGRVRGNPSMFLTLSFSPHSPSPKINKILKTKAPAPRGGRQPVGDTPGCVVALACSAHSARRPPACPRSTWSWSLPLSRQPEPPLSRGPVALTPHAPARHVPLARGGVGSPRPCSVPWHPRLAHRPPRKYSPLPQPARAVFRARGSSEPRTTHTELGRVGCERTLGIWETGSADASSLTLTLSP